MIPAIILFTSSRDSLAIKMLIIKYVIIKYYINKKKHRIMPINL